MPDPRKNRTRAPRRAWCVLAVLALAASVAACSTGSNSDSDNGSKPKTIVVGVGSAPLSLDPAKNGNTADMQLVMDLAYEPLIRLSPDGSFAPGLATSWKYTDSTLTTFELKLRSDAKFSDGTPVTAQSVVDSLDYQKETNGPIAIYLKQIKSWETVDEQTVRLHLAKSDPTIELMLTQRFQIGDIVGPAGIKDPDSLGTTTSGAGPYMLDPEQTVSGDHYTYVPNPHYYDSKAVHFDTFTVKVLANPQAALNALQTGQVAYVNNGNASLADAAESAGLKVYSTLSAWYAIFLFDRDGVLVPALKDQRVRQALNYATDREGIMSALFGKYGEPNSEISLPGYEDMGYDPDYKDRYPHDVERAKELLAEAGYPDGFEMTIGATAPFGNGPELTQAIANDWSEIGVKVNIKTFGDIGSIVTPWSGKKLPAVAGYYDGQPLFVTAGQTLSKDAGLFNPFATEDAELTSLIDTAYAATDSDQSSEAWAAVQRRVVDLGWFVPVGTGSAIYFADPDLQGVDLSPTSFAPNPTLFHY